MHLIMKTKVVSSYLGLQTRVQTLKKSKKVNWGSVRTPPTWGPSKNWKTCLDSSFPILGQTQGWGVHTDPKMKCLTFSKSIFGLANPNKKKQLLFSWFGGQNRDIFNMPYALVRLHTFLNSANLFLILHIFQYLGLVPLLALTMVSEADFNTSNTPHASSQKNVLQLSYI